jgi:hypothetical protein
MRIRTLALAGTAVAAVGYLLDPRRGRARRDRLGAAIPAIARRRGQVDLLEPLPENLAPSPSTEGATAPDLSEPIATAPERRGTIAPARPDEPVATAQPVEPVAAPTQPEPVATPVAGSSERMAKETPPADDAAIVRRVRTKLQERRDLRAGELVIDVVNGVAYIAGDLRDPQTFGEIVDLTGQVPGVRRVQSLLHVPDSETVVRTMARGRPSEPGNGGSGSLP